MLFLGYAIIQLPEISFSLYRFLKRWKSQHNVQPLISPNLKQINRNKNHGLDAINTNEQLRDNKKEKYHMRKRQGILAKELRKQILLMKESLRNERRMELLIMKEDLSKEMERLFKTKNY